MQKQHLHVLLLIWAAMMLGGCGEPKFGPQNPYLQGEQTLSIPLADSLQHSVWCGGWEFLPIRSHAQTSEPLRVKTPDGHLIQVDWLLEGAREPIQFSGRVLDARHLTLSNPALGLACEFDVAQDGRGWECVLNGESSSPITAILRFDLSGQKHRGLAAQESPWSPIENGFSVRFPWDESWQVFSDAIVATEPIRRNEIAASIAFGKKTERALSFRWTELPGQKDERGLDIVCESDATNRALALLIGTIPPVAQAIPLDNFEREARSDLAEAQWLTHAEFSPNYLTDMQAEEGQVEFLTYGLSAYETLFEWGCLPQEDVSAAQPMFDAAVSRLDLVSRRITLGATIYDRCREAAAWNFAENHLSFGNPNLRNRYARRASEARDDAQDDLRRGVHLNQVELQRRRADSLLQLRESAGDLLIHRFHSNRNGSDLIRFEPPDSLALLRIVGRANLGWFETVDKRWLELADMPWPLQLELARYRFDQSIRIRVSLHWQRTQHALLGSTEPAYFPPSEFGASYLECAAAEVETITHSYLGIQPDWSGSKITFHARLPEGWGRTRARVPFGQGEIYVDYDFANKQAWVAANRLDKVYTCSFYMPTSTGALSQQFKLEPGDGPVMISLVEDKDSVLKLRFESASLPE